MEQHDQQQRRQAFGSLLRSHRQSAGLTQEQLAERAGLSRRGIADIERGARLVPYAHTIDRLAAGLGLSETEHASLIEAAQAQKAASSHPVGERRAGPNVQTKPKHNLPQRPNRFIGRDNERRQVASLLRSSALVTLVGPGGVGKTRLALELAADQIEAWRNGVWLVELSSVTAAPLVPHAVGAALGIAQEPGHDVSDDLIDWLRDRQLLLVLDNCEHVLEACGSLVAQVLRRCPDVHVLATSREVLAIDGEVLYRVDPLSVPGIGVVSADTACESESVRLFVERASAAAPGFNVTDQNAAALVNVCRRLDGLPLALELTAARLRVLSVHDIAQRLDQRFDLLTGGHRDGLARHRTLRTLIDWSYDLLDATERELFEQLSVFTGGWTLDAAEAVCSTTDTTLDVLARLVDKSLVRTEPQLDGSLRFEMLETLREYAAERLRSNPRASQVVQRHALFYADAVSRWFDNVWWGDNTQARLVRIARDYANFRTSARWLIDHVEVDAAQRQAASLTLFWILQGSLQDGLAWLREVHALTNQSTQSSTAGLEVVLGLSLMVGEARPVSLARLEAEIPNARAFANQATLALALMQVGRLAWLVRHDLVTARAYLEDAASIANATQIRPLAALIRAHLAGLLYETGEYQLAASLLEENLRTGSAFDSYLSQDKLILSWVRFAQGKTDAAASLLQQVLAEPYTSRSPHWRLVAYTALSWTRLAQHDLPAAIAAARHSLTIAREHLGPTMSPGFLGGPLEAFAEIASATGQHPRALRLAAAAATLREAHQIRLSPSERELLARWMTRSRLALGAEASERHASAGRTLTSAAAISEALAVAEAPEARRALAALTPREREIVPLVARGLTNREIAQELVISEGTARIHVERVLGKLGLRSRTQLAARYAASGPDVCLSADAGLINAGVGFEAPSR